VLHLQSKCPFTSGNRSRNLKKSIGQEYQSVQDVFSFVSIFHLDCMTFYRDTTFSFQIHAVKQLCFSSRAVTVCVAASKRSSVLLPWSICAIMQKFLYVSYSVCVNFIKELSCQFKIVFATANAFFTSILIVWF
jgi:hypothetical protein